MRAVTALMLLFVLLAAGCSSASSAASGQPLPEGRIPLDSDYAPK